MLRHSDFHNITVRCHWFINHADGCITLKFERELWKNILYAYTLCYYATIYKDAILCNTVFTPNSANKKNKLAVWWLQNVNVNPYDEPFTYAARCRPVSSRRLERSTRPPGCHTQILHLWYTPSNCPICCNGK